MADLEDLPIVSITDMTNDEQLELLRQIRLSRRTPTKQVKVTTKSTYKVIPEVSADQAAELLKMLKGK